MRQIEFRAWHKKEKRMYDVEAIDFINGLARVSIYESSSEETAWELPWDDIILMQSTGFKDIQGNEIFEGDVFKEGIISGIKTPILYEVYWNKKSAAFAWRQPIPVVTFGVNVKKAEVIGNIYENPELLTKA